MDFYVASSKTIDLEENDLKKIIKLNVDEFVILYQMFAFIIVSLFTSFNLSA